MYLNTFIYYSVNWQRLFIFYLFRPHVNTIEIYLYTALVMQQSKRCICGIYGLKFGQVVI